MNKLSLTLLICMTIITTNTFADVASKSIKKLSTIHTKILRKYPSVKHINTSDFMQLEQNRTLIFDVRQLEEYVVSHLKNAIQIDPDTKINEFVAEYSEELSDKTIVFYCSVGERSSKLAEQLKPSLEAQGALASFNLVGGLFQWHNEKRKLMREDTETTLIHPYNRYWGRLIDDKNTISYESSDKALESEYIKHDRK